MTIDVHQGDEGVEDSQGLPSSHVGEIDSNEEERSVQLQAEEDARKSCTLRNRKRKSSRPEEDVRCPREDGNGKEKSSRPEEDVRCPSEDGNGKSEKSFRPGFELYGVGIYVEGIYYMARGLLAVKFGYEVIRLVIFLFLFLCSHSSSGKLYVHVDSKDQHQNILEMWVVETPLHSVQLVAQNGTWVFKWARHDSLLLRTADDKWYKAEKLGPSSGQAGIHFYPVTRPGAETIRFQSSISVNFSLAQALPILKDHKLGYNLWGENCWKYAHARAEAILNSCIEIASDDNVLQKELENLMDARRRMPNEVVDVREISLLWVLLFFFTGLFSRCFFGFAREIFISRSSNFSSALVNMDIVADFYTLVVLYFVAVLAPNPIVLTYNLTWLATTYRWLFCFLFLFSYYVGWTLCLRSADSFMFEVAKDPDMVAATHMLRTAVLGKIGQISFRRAIYYQERSMEVLRRKWPSRTLVYGFSINYIAYTCELTLGYSFVTTYLRVYVALALAVTTVWRTRRDEIRITIYNLFTI